MDTSSNTQFLQQSDIRAVTALCKQYDGINLGQGICDQPAPATVKNAARKAIRDDHSVYSHYSGIDEIKQALMEKFTGHNQLPINSADQLMITNGSTGAFVTAIHALCDPGDHVVLFEPYYGYHVNICNLLNIKTSGTPLRGADWQIDWADLESTMRESTKAIILTTPNNPCGKVFSRSELEKLITIAQQYDCILITDEVYEYMTYDDHRHISVGSLPGGWERSITLTSFSKTFNITGWRLGAAAGPADMIEKMGLVSDLLYICPPTPLQHGLAAGLHMDEAYYEQLKNTYAEKRELMCTTLEDCGFAISWPQGAYYAFADFEAISRNREGFSDDITANETLIKQAGVAAVPGRSFYSDPEDGRYKLRFCFAKKFDVLQQACDRLREFFR